MKLKKVLALTLAGIMTVGLAACGGTKESRACLKIKNCTKHMFLCPFS